MQQPFITSVNYSLLINICITWLIQLLGLCASFNQERGLACCRMNNQEKDETMPLLNFRGDNRTIAEPVLRRESPLVRFHSTRRKWSDASDRGSQTTQHHPSEIRKYKGMQPDTVVSGEVGGLVQRWFSPSDYSFPHQDLHFPRYNQSHFPKRHLYFLQVLLLKSVTSSRPLR